ASWSGTRRATRADGGAMSDRFATYEMDHNTNGPLGHTSDDTLPFTLPGGQAYSNAQLTVLHARNGGGCRISNEPGRGTVGAGAVTVHWYYNGGGRIHYRLDLFADAEAVQPGQPASATFSSD